MTTDKDESHFLDRELGKTYFSKSFTNFDTFKKRFAHKILDFEHNEYLLEDERTIGRTYLGPRQLKALFLVDDRKIEKLIIQWFGENYEPILYPKKQVSFESSEIENLYQFLKSIKEVDFQNENKHNITNSELKRILLNKEQTLDLINENFEILQEAFRNNITTNDLINFGYRKGQLEIFRKLLFEDGYFLFYKTELSESQKRELRDEDVWQRFFEKNTWILGYGLDYIFNTELDEKKLEQITSGSDFSSKGKRIDALLKSQGAINSLCFCELKLNNHPLLKQVKDSHRPESWQISNELAGAIAQVQQTTQKAIRGIKSKTEVKDSQDNLTGETLYLYNPKSFILIGNLNEFIVDDRINETKFSCFEMFRKNLRNIEILTYDELYKRAFYICNKKD